MLSEIAFLLNSSEPVQGKPNGKKATSQARKSTSSTTIPNQTRHDHVVEFHADPEGLNAAAYRFLQPGFAGGHPVLIIAKPASRETIRAHFRRDAMDFDGAIAGGQVLLADAESTLSSYMEGDLANAALFTAATGELMQQVRRLPEPEPVFFHGEMADMLWQTGRIEAALYLERLWNALAASLGLEMFRGYPLNRFYKVTHHMRSHHRCHERPTGNGAQLLAREVEHRLLRTIQQLRVSERRAMRAEGELRDFFENAVEGLHWVGPDGRIIWANRAELDLLGYSPDEYIGHCIREFHADPGIITDIMARLMRNETLKDYEARLRCKDGSIRTVLINSNVMWENGEFVHTRCFTRDITHQRRGEFAESQLAAIVESADDAIVGKTLKGIVTSWNPGAERIFGYTADEMIGQSITRLMPPERVAEEPDILGKIRAGKRVDHYETQRQKKDGQIIDISITVSPVRDRSGRIVGASKIARDITERKKVESESAHIHRMEEEARQQAEQASRMKDEFLAVLSHELRTPLNAIIGWTSILGTTGGQKHVDHAVEVIARNADLQRRLIEDLLDMSRILSGKMALEVHEVAVQEVIAAALDTLRTAALAKSIALNVDIEDCIEPIPADADRLQQVIWNLLSNAVKFTPNGGRVDVVARKRAAEIEIVVRDNGQGIPSDFLPFVFDRFRQAQQGTARQHTGLGLGLAVVRHLVELHGGSVAVDSAGVGTGATFTVRLPVRKL